MHISYANKGESVLKWVDRDNFSDDRVTIPTRHIWDQNGKVIVTKFSSLAAVGKDWQFPIKSVAKISSKSQQLFLFLEPQEIFKFEYAEVFSIQYHHPPPSVQWILTLWKYLYMYIAAS